MDERHFGIASRPLRRWVEAESLGHARDWRAARNGGVRSATCNVHQCAGRQNSLNDVWTTLRGARLHSVEAQKAEGIPIVLIPGLAMSGRYLLPLARLLADHYRVRVLELPGFGCSTGPRRALSMQEHAAWIHEWMLVRGTNACHLVGHSMGCQVVAHLAAAHPDRARTLVLIGPTIDIHARKRTTQILRLAQDFTKESFTILFWALLDVLRAGILRTWRTSTEMMGDRIEAQLTQITAPTHLLRGKNDPIAPESWLQTAANFLSTGRSQTLPVGAHCVQFSDPERTAAVIIGWIEHHAP